MPTSQPTGKELTPSQLQELRRIEDDYYSMLASEGEVAYSIYQDAYKDFITNDRFVRLTRAPTEADRRPKGNSQYHSSAVVDNGGWWMVLDFRSEDYPQLQSQLEQIMHLKAERFAALQAFIEGI